MVVVKVFSLFRASQQLNRYDFLLRLQSYITFFISPNIFDFIFCKHFINFGSTLSLALGFRR